MQITPNFISSISAIKPMQSKSFKGTEAVKADEFTLNSPNNIKEADLFADRVLFIAQQGNAGLSKIEKLARKSIPIVKAQEISDLDKLMGKGASQRYHAYSLPEYGEGCNLKKLTIYVPEIKQTDSQEKQVRSISSVAHEFTHCLQRSKDTSYLGLKDVANGNLLSARCLNNVSSMVFGDIEQLRVSINLLDSDGTETEESLQQNLYKAFDCKSQEDFKKLVKRTFLNSFNNTYDTARLDPDVKKYLPFYNSPRDLRNAVKNQCKIRADMEQEAYTVQKNVIEKHDAKQLTAIDKYSPIFYEEVAKALA